ncbi:MAG: hypothetical protein ACRD3J_32120, partial [Thermoanaerobaculia bacterium]
LLRDLFPTPSRVLTEHLKHKLGKIPDCPLCGTNGWVLAGPASQMLEKFKVTGDGQIKTDMSGTLPIISIVCENCAYTLQFAWNDVQRHWRTASNKS